MIRGEEPAAVPVPAGAAPAIRIPTTFANANIVRGVRPQIAGIAESAHVAAVQGDGAEARMTEITVSRTPPWKKNSILSQQPQAIVVQAGERVPHLQPNVVQQMQGAVRHPPWQDEAQGRRVVAKKRPNFKEDPTGYLEHQTAILHSSIPELQDDSSPTGAPNGQMTFQQTKAPQGGPSALVSVMQQQNQNPTLVHQDGVTISKAPPPQVVIGPNGQPVRIIQNPQQIFYTGAGGFRMQATQGHRFSGHQQPIIVKSTANVPSSLTVCVSQANEIVNNCDMSQRQALNRAAILSNNRILKLKDEPPASTHFGHNAHTAHTATIEVTSRMPVSSGVYIAGQTTGRNTITSVLAGKAMTSTTSTVNQGQPLGVDRLRSGQHILKTSNATILTQSKSNIMTSAVQPSGGSTTMATQNCTSIQQLCGDGGNGGASQIIMTSSGPILLMSSPSTNDGKGQSGQVIIGNVSNSNALLVNSQSNGSNIMVNTQNSQIIGSEMLQSLSGSTSPNFAANAVGNNVVIQNANVVAGNQNLLQSPNNSGGFILGSSNNMQQMLLNNSNLLSHSSSVLQPGGANMLQSNGGSLITAASSAKVISNIGSQNIINQSNVQIPSGGLLSPGAGMVGQQTVVLNQLSGGGYVIQPQTITTVDGQMLNVINSDGSSATGNSPFGQQQPRIIVSPDSKRRTALKRKSTSMSPSTPQNSSPLPSPTVHQQPHQQMLQIQPQYQSQSFQISPGGAGITLMHNKAAAQPQQQILLQNGQTILQPINLIGQQLLMPAGLMMAPDATTLLQIQNVAPSIITQQGMVLRTSQSSQNKGFLSPNTANQQFIVNGNGQISPIGQMYTTPMGLVVPQSNNGASYVQQNTAIVQGQQQTTMMAASNAASVSRANADIQAESVSTQTAVNSAASPPDTTTHSPRSPERPPSQKSVGNDVNMVSSPAACYRRTIRDNSSPFRFIQVQYVSSSEPDSVVSPMMEEQMSSSRDFESQNSEFSRFLAANEEMTPLYSHCSEIDFRTNSLKGNEPKLRRTQLPAKLTRQSGSAQQQITYKVMPDSHGNSFPSISSMFRFYHFITSLITAIDCMHCEEKLMWNFVINKHVVISFAVAMSRNMERE